MAKGIFVLIAVALSSVSSGFAVIASAASPPQLGDGFTVADGSTLVGTVFPGWTPDTHDHTEPAMGDDRWSAVLQVTGNPIQVFNRYLAQAQAAGFDARARCRVDYRDRGSEPASSDAFKSGDVIRLVCESNGQTAANPGGSKGFTMELRRSSGDEPYDNYILLRVARELTGTLPAVPDQGQLTTLPADWTAFVPERPRTPKVPTTGHLIRRAGRGFTRPIHVVEGSTVLAPPALPCPNRGGFDVVLKVSGDLDRVLDDYAKQFRAIDLRNKARKTGTFRRHQFVTDTAYGETGAYSAVAVEGLRGEATYLYLWFCGTS